MILVDTNVLIDIVGEDPLWFDWSSRMLSSAADLHGIGINQIIYAEISIGYASEAALQSVLDEVGIRLVPLPFAAGFVAGKAFVEYRRRGGARTSPLPDFYIGAHAAIDRMPLLTRDRRRHEGYFPSVEIIAPDRV